MERPTKEQVDVYLRGMEIVRDDPHAGLTHAGWKAHALGLAAEVRALRKELKAVRDGVWKWIATDNEDAQDLLDVIKEKP